MPGWKEIMVRYELNAQMAQDAERERLAELALSAGRKPGFLGAALKSAMLLVAAIF